MKASGWIDRVKAARGWDSDYRVAKELGISRQTVSGYRSERYTLDEDSAIKVAHALEQPPEAILVDQVAERAKNPEAKAAWLHIAQRLQTGAANLSLVVSIAIVLLALTAHPVWAETASFVGEEGSLYIMLSASCRVIFRLCAHFVKLCKAGGYVSSKPHATAFLPA